MILDMDTTQPPLGMFDFDSGVGGEGEEPDPGTEWIHYRQRRRRVGWLLNQKDR